MTYSYSFTDSSGCEHEGQGQDLTELAKELSELLTATAHETRVEIYDEPGFKRGWAKAGEWHLEG